MIFLQEAYANSKRAEVRRKHKRKRTTGFLVLWTIIGVLILSAFLASELGNGEDLTGARGDDLSGLTIASNSQEPEDRVALGADLQDKHLKPVAPRQGEAVLPTISYNEGQKVVYLTIDDGPSAHTKVLLDILDNYGVKASFFMLEPNMQKHPDEVIRMVESGQGVGMHSVTHNKKLFYANKESVVQEMTQGQATLNALTGVTSHLIRAPYGSSPYMTDEYKQAVKDAGFIMWDWNVDSLDWKFRSEAYVGHTIKQVRNLKNKSMNSVILIHDTEATVTYLPKLLDYLITSGYTLQVLTDQIEPVQFK